VWSWGNERVEVRGWVVVSRVGWGKEGGAGELQNVSVGGGRLRGG